MTQIQRMRPETTLFTLASADGKISTGDNDGMDFDVDLPQVAGVRQGLAQYYALEKQTDSCSLNSGKVMAKIGVNERTDTPIRLSISLVIIDRLPHLTASGLTYLTKWVNKVYLVTDNADHPAHKMTTKNLEVLFYPGGIDFVKLFAVLGTEHGIKRITIQSGGTLNAIFLQKNLIDHVSIVIAPCLIGGMRTPTLVGGESLHASAELTRIRALKLRKCTVLDGSYINVIYDVVFGSRQ